MPPKTTPKSSAAVQVTEFIWPRATGEWVAASGTLALYLTGLVAPSLVVPGSAAWDLLADYFPGGGPSTFLWLVKRLFYIIAAAHAGEMILFDLLRLRKHGVARFSALWWKWELCVFIEGIAAWVRIGKYIARKEKLL